MSKLTLSEFTMDTTLAFGTVDVASPQSVEPEELEQYGYRPPCHSSHRCSSQSLESMLMSDSASEMNAGQWV